MQKLILNRFAAVCQERPSDTAIYALSIGQTRTFSELGREYQDTAIRLRNAGVGARDCVVAAVGNRPALFALLLACLDLDAVLLLLDRVVRPAEAATIAAKFGARVLVAPATVLPANYEHAGLIDDDLQVLTLFPAIRHDFQDAAVIKLTSGSTGAQRGVLVSELSLWNDARHIIEVMAIAADDVNLAVIPLAHSYGLGNLVMPLLMQGTAVALRESFTPNVLLQDIERTSATVLPGVPFMFEYLLNHLSAERLPKSLRLLISAGAPLSTQTVDAYYDRFRIKIHSFYGTSETGGICYDASDSVGAQQIALTPLPETTVELIPIDQLDSTDCGVVQVTGNAVASGYLAMPGTTIDPTFDGNRFRTTDIGRFESDGRLVLTARVSSFVNVAGRKVDPYEVEATLREMSDVADARVIGMQCPQRGEKLVALIVPTHAGVRTMAVRAWCAERLAPHKVPRDIAVVETFPVDARGKTSRERLLALASAALGRSASTDTKGDGPR